MMKPKMLKRTAKAAQLGFCSNNGAYAADIRRTYQSGKKSFFKVKI